MSTTATTKLALARVRRGVTSAALADATGISPATLWRLEHGLVRDPSIRELANCALALGVELEDIIEDDLRRWSDFDKRRPGPPDATTFWHET